MTVQQRNSQMVDILRADFQGRYEPQFALAQVMSHIMALPGLRGFWPMSAYDASGNAFDQSGNARTLTYNGNPTYNFDGLAPYIDLDGTGDYLSRADEAGLDILGTEAYVANPGLTLGGWFFVDGATAALSGLLSKWGGGGTSYLMDYQTASGNATFVVSSPTTLSPGVAVSTDVWHFIVGRYVPSSSVGLFVDDAFAETTSSVPASLTNSSTNFEIGRRDSVTARVLTGRASLCFLCASALSDAIIGNLFQQSRALFGV